MRTVATAVAAFGLLATFLSAAPARADADDWGGGYQWRHQRWHEREWRRHEWREHHRAWYPGYSYYYAPPPVYYTPPPSYYYTPGVTIGFGFR